MFFQKKFFCKFLLLSIFFITFFPLLARAEGLNELVIPSLNKTAEESKLVEKAEQTFQTFFIESKIGYLITLILSFVAGIFFLFVFYGGFLWMTAHGNGDQITKARKLIVQSTVALGIIAFSYLITLSISKIATKATGTKYTQGESQ